MTRTESIQKAIELAYERLENLKAEIKAAEEETKAAKEKVVEFEVGKTYATNSACDSNCWFIYTVIKRTAKSVVIRDKFGKEKRCMIKKGGYFKDETIYPQGSYSMCPVLRATDIL